MVRDPYVVEIADACRVDIDHLRRFAAGGHSMVPQHAGDDERAEFFRFTPEDEALRMAIHRPEAVGDTLHPSLFGDLLRREAFEALAASGSVTTASEMVSPAAARLLHRLAVDAGDADVDDVLAGLARLAAGRAMQDLRRMAASGDDADFRRQCIDSIGWLKSQSEQLGDRNAREEILEPLLAWLAEHGRRQA